VGILWKCTADGRWKGIEIRLFMLIRDPHRSTVHFVEFFPVYPLFYICFLYILQIYLSHYTGYGGTRCYSFLKVILFMIISSICSACLVNSLSLIFLFSQNFVVLIIPWIGRLTYGSFMSRVIIHIFLLIFILFSSSATSCFLFFVLYVYGRQIM